MAKETESVNETYMTTMTPLEWASVPDNPRQRDTERRATSSKHLFKLEASHLLVHMAEWNGGRCKLEGHTRAKVWGQRPEIAPDYIDVRVYVVSGLEEAKRLYGHFNSREEAETSKDRLFGAMRECDISPESTFVKTAKFSNAVRSARGYLSGMSPAQEDSGAVKCSSGIKGSVYDAVQKFSSEIKALDRADISSKKAYGAVVCCYLMAHRKHGDAINEFFARYQKDAGVKDGRSKDCVQLFSEAMEEFRLVGASGFQPMHEAVRIGLACIDRWIKSPEAMLSRSPRCDPFRYLD